MPRKPKKGYYVKGEFVAEGSARDLELKAELKGLRDADDSTRSDQKKESEALQTLGQELLELHPKTLERLQLPEKLLDALHEYQRLTSFEAKRRQLQFVGKLMRKLEDSEVAAARTALHEQRSGTGPEQTQILLAEQWRDRLIADDAALTLWLEHYPGTDVQPLRALVRQARKDQAQAAVAEGAPPAKKGRAYRDLFQLLRRSLNTDAAAEDPAQDDGEDEAND
ncbi:ribosome biogenesis factor YjgA [Comamonas nitrativorans]|uniref:Dual-action ribosomal maturation protein DarP n=1 Tax=Comamonas nitrativorans TaxID=108437 RepID=A0ABV9H1N5_9BURK